MKDEELLLDFFLWFRENWDSSIWESIEDMIQRYLNKK